MKTATRLLPALALLALPAAAFAQPNNGAASPNPGGGGSSGSGAPATHMPQPTTSAPAGGSPGTASSGSTAPTGTGTGKGEASTQHDSRAGGQMGAQPDQRVETHIKRLHEKLGITQNEEGAWQQVAQAMRENAGMIRQSYQQRAAQLASMTALDNMKSYAGLAQERAAEAQKMLAAFQPLYDQMTPEQKAKADQVFRAEAQRHAERVREMHNHSS